MSGLKYLATRRAGPVAMPLRLSELIRERIVRSSYRSIRGSPN